MSALARLGLTSDISNQKSSSTTQQQTDEAFGFKWSKRDTYESEASKANMRRWLLERYCNDDPVNLDRWLQGSRKIILDAGCGAGFSGLLFFGEHLKNHDYLGVDISSSVNVAKTRFNEAGIPGDFLRCDLAKLPLPDESIDMIFSEGVLHHTDSPEKTMKYLADKVVPGGHFLFYVYRKKGVIREFTDDHIRNSLSEMSDEKAWEAIKSLTSLGKALGELNATIDIKEDISYLGIKAGKLDLQRFFYWNICKAYYRPELSSDEMNHINFDWFRPLNCHRHTEQEVQGWCEDTGLVIEHQNIQESGITIVARKTGQTNE